LRRQSLFAGASSAAWIGFIVVMLLGPGTSTAREAAQDDTVFEANFPVAIDERVTDPPVDLENAFWRCDRAATQQLVDAGTAALCGAITEELKAKRFEGDFDMLLAWWRENKDAEHAAVDAAGAEIPLP
jgi:hypothetical protein